MMDARATSQPRKITYCVVFLPGPPKDVVVLHRGVYWFGERLGTQCPIEETGTPLPDGIEPALFHHWGTAAHKAQQADPNADYEYVRCRRCFPSD